jgi:BirA family biotin operon repressor/biotin-[acetyl-CoA-carboxylase] ligase
VPKPTAPLDAQRVRAQLASTRFADVRYVAQTASTNADAQGLLGTPDCAGATLVAEYQTAGAGRKGRRWIAPPGSALLFTAMLPAPVAAATLWAVPFWIALNVADAVETTTGVKLELVWPNDLYARDGKTGGILSVARIAGNDAWVGCGVGLNVVRPDDDAELAQLETRPTFIDDMAPGIEREALLVAILETFDGTFDALREPGDIALRWARRAALLGTIYRYRNDADGIERTGIAQRIGAHGELIVRDGDGEHAIQMADVRITGRGSSGGAHGN